MPTTIILLTIAGFFCFCAGLGCVCYILFRGHYDKTSLKVGQIWEYHDENPYREREYIKILDFTEKYVKYSRYYPEVRSIAARHSGKTIEFLRNNYEYTPKYLLAHYAE